MLSEIINAVAEFFQQFFSMFSTKDKGPQILPSNILRVFIKHVSSAGGVQISSTSGPTTPSPNHNHKHPVTQSQTVAVDLDIKWSIKQVKGIIAPKLNLSADEIKIIFAGKELPDDLILETCNVGQQSFLHAVRVQVKQVVNVDAGEVFNHEDIGTATEGIHNYEGMEIDAVARSTQLPSTVEVKKSSLDDLIPASISDATEFPALVDTTGSTHSDSNSKSEFFVYCETCQGLREGKLRVRCAICMSGAFTVLRDPENWDDVLKPNQVPGSCETLECPSNFSQFYFKCKSHITAGEDDTSCPLPLVKHNPESIPCLACGDSRDPVFVFQCPAKHVTCIECFQQYALLKTNQRQFVLHDSLGYTLGCPVLCENSCIEDIHHFKLMGKYQYDRYQRFGAEECVLKAGGVLCPQPDCGMGIIPTEEGCNKVACLHGCGFVFCRVCLEGWHVGECSRDSSISFATGSSSGGTYAVAYERVAKAQWDDDSRRALRLSTKPCPKCRVATERAGGCMHMECTKCSFQWCWVCQNKWTRDCMGNHWFG